MRLCNSSIQQKTRPARWLWVGSVLLESESCLLRSAYAHTHPCRQQQQQSVGFVFGIIVIANLLYRCQPS
jgi:hypothetical protein